MSILTTHDVQTVDRMCVGRAGEGGALYRRPLTTPCVPQYNLTRVGSPNHIVRMELAEGHRHDWTLYIYSGECVVNTHTYNIR